MTGNFETHPRGARSRRSVTQQGESMRRILIPLAVLFVLGVGVQANAGALSLLEPYVVNWLEDDDVEFAVVADGTSLQVDDILVGMVVINPFVQTMEGPNVGDQRLVVNTGATFTGVFAVKVVSKTGAGPYTYDFGNVSAADWLTLTGYTINDPDTMAVLFDDSDPPSFINTGVGTVLGSLATAMNGTYLWEFGFDASDPGSLFWTAVADSDVIANIAGNASSLRFNAALDVTDYGAGPQLLPFSLFPVLGAQAFAGVTSDLAIIGRNTLGGSGDFPVTTDSEIYLKPTPEPASLALLGLGLLGLGGVVYRRRRS
jgi:hypothetical protein